MNKNKGTQVEKHEEKLSLDFTMQTAASFVRRNPNLKSQKWNKW